MPNSSSKKPPYLRSSLSSAHIFWGNAFALLPSAFAAVYFFRWEAVSIIGTAVSAALLAEVFFCFLMKKSPLLSNGETLLLGLVFGLFCPPQVPLIAVAASAFAAVLIAKEFFGGSGKTLFHPSMLAAVFLYLLARPEIMELTQTISVQNIEVNSFGLLKQLLLWNENPVFIGAGFPSWILAGGLFLGMRQLIDWRMPIIFFVTCASIAFGFLEMPWPYLLTDGTFFVAFYVITLTTTNPLSKEGRALFAFIAAIILMFLRVMGYGYLSFPAAVLLMNAAGVWMNLMMKPKGLR